MLSTSKGVVKDCHYTISKNDHSSQNASFVYTVIPPKVKNMLTSHHTPPVYTYIIASPTTKIQGLYHLYVDHYVETNYDPRGSTYDIVNRKLKVLEDTTRSFRGLRSNQSTMYEEICVLLEIKLPLHYKIPNFKKFNGSKYTIFYLKIYCKSLLV